MQSPNQLMSRKDRRALAKEQHKDFIPIANYQAQNDPRWKATAPQYTVKDPEGNTTITLADHGKGHDLDIVGGYQNKSGSWILYSSKHCWIRRMWNRLINRMKWTDIQLS